MVPRKCQNSICCGAGPRQCTCWQMRRGKTNIRGLCRTALEAASDRHLILIEALSSVDTSLSVRSAREPSRNPVWQAKYPSVKQTPSLTLGTTFSPSSFAGGDRSRQWCSAGEISLTCRPTQRSLRIAISPRHKSSFWQLCTSYSRSSSVSIR